jgi:DNA-binding XRE family transcriptional regulator
LKLDHPKPLLASQHLVRPRHPLRLARDRAGVTQGQAARQLQIGRERLAKLEEGQILPTYGIARRMAAVYRCELATLARAAEIPPPLLLTRRRGVAGSWPDVLRQLRDWHDISVPALARVAQVRPQTVRNWERGETRPSAAKCLLVERTFNLAQDALRSSC